MDEVRKPHILIEDQPGLELGGANDDWDLDCERLVNFSTELAQDWLDDAHV